MKVQHAENECIEGKSQASRQTDRMRALHSFTDIHRHKTTEWVANLPTPAGSKGDGAREKDVALSNSNKDHNNSNDDNKNNKDNKDKNDKNDKNYKNYNSSSSSSSRQHMMREHVFLSFVIFTEICINEQKIVTFGFFF